MYSLNWFPIGGFVKIKGEDGGSEADADSFGSKSAWIRIQVLIAGVLMNFLFAWILLSGTFMFGTYQDVTGEHLAGSRILIQGVEEGSPAQQMGLRVGDILLSGEKQVFKSVEDVQIYVKKNGGKEIVVNIQRGEKEIQLRGVPRQQAESGQGALGISGMGEVVVVKFSLWESLKKGLVEIGMIILLMFDVFKRLFSGNSSGLTVT